MKEFHGIIKNGRFELSLTQLQQRTTYLKSLKDDTRIIETLRKEGKSKSWEQVKTHFGLAVTTILRDFSDRGWDTSCLLNMPKPTGIEVSVGLLQEFLYAVCPIHNDTGERVTLSKMTTVQASQFFEDIRNYAASQWSIYIPDPDPNYKGVNNEPERTSPEIS